MKNFFVGAWLFLILVAVPAVVAQGEYILPWFRVAGGGGASSAESYNLRGTIGQHEAGGMSGGQYGLTGGFWVVAAGTPTLGASPTPSGTATPSFTPTEGPSPTPSHTTTAGPSPTPPKTATAGPSPTATPGQTIYLPMITRWSLEMEGRR